MITVYSEFTRHLDGLPFYGHCHQAGTSRTSEKAQHHCCHSYWETLIVTAMQESTLWRWAENRRFTEPLPGETARPFLSVHAVTRLLGGAGRPRTPKVSRAAGRFLLMAAGKDAPDGGAPAASPPLPWSTQCFSHVCLDESRLPPSTLHQLLPECCHANLWLVKRGYHACSCWKGSWIGQQHQRPQTITAGPCSVMATWGNARRGRAQAARKLEHIMMLRPAMMTFTWLMTADDENLYLPAPSNSLSFHHGAWWSFCWSRFWPWQWCWDHHHLSDIDSIKKKLEWLEVFTLFRR